MTPTQRSLQKLRADGYTACVVERWIPRVMVRKDAFGFGDILGIRGPDTGALLVQTTTASHSAAREKKIVDLPEAALWVGCGNRIEVHSWAKRGGRGARKVWTCVVVSVGKEDL